MQKTIYSPIYRCLIDHLRQARKKQKLRQEDVGRKLGVSRHWIQKVETHQVRLDVVQFVILCRVYRADPSRLIRRLEEELPDEGDPSFYLSWVMLTAYLVCKRTSSRPLQVLRCHMFEFSRSGHHTDSQRLLWQAQFVKLFEWADV